MSTHATGRLDDPIEPLGDPASERGVGMTHPSGRSQEILAAVLLESREWSITLPVALCQACARTVPMTGAAMVLKSVAGLDRMVGATSGMADTMEGLQFEFGEGPGVDAVRQDGPVLVSTLDGALRRWPLYTPAALDAGVRAAFAFPLQVGGIRLGVLDLYRDEPGSLFDGVLFEALAYAQAATAVLLHLQALSGGTDSLHPQLTGFAADRAEIHQATGMISAQAEVTLVEALLLLRARAFAADRSMLSLSQDIIARRLRFDPDLSADPR